VKKPLMRLPISTLLLLFFAAATLALPAAAAEGGAATLPAAEKPSPEQAAALKILDEAADLQGADAILSHLENFRASFNLEVFDPDRGRGNFEVERFFAYKGDSGIMWTKKKRADTSDPWSAIVFDGTEAWRIGEKDGGEKEVVIFTDKPAAYKTHLTNINDDVRLTAQMFRFFFVRNLAGAMKDARFVGERRLNGTPVFVIEGTASAWLRKEGRTVVHLRIAVDREKHTIAEVRITDLARGGKQRIFRFERYTRNDQGVLIPCRIKIYGEDETNYTMQIALKVETREEKGEDGKTVKHRIPKIIFNASFPEKAFSIPDVAGKGS